MSRLADVPVRGAREPGRPRLARADPRPAAPLRANRARRGRARAGARLGAERARRALAQRARARRARVGRPRRGGGTRTRARRDCTARRRRRRRVRGCAAIQASLCSRRPKARRRARARARCAASRRISARSSRLAWSAASASLEARLLAATADHDGAAAVAGTAVDGTPESPGLQAVRARLALAAGDAEGALEALAEPTRRGLPDRGRRARRAPRAGAPRARRRHARRSIELEAALARAEPEAIRRPFLSAGRGVRELLAEHLRRAVSHRWFASELMRRLEGAAAARASLPRSCSSRSPRARARCFASCRR